MKPWHLFASFLIGALLGWLAAEHFGEPRGSIDEQYPRIDSLEQDIASRDLRLSELEISDSIQLARIDSFKQHTPPFEIRYRDGYREGRALPVPAVIDSLMQRPE